MSGNDGGRVSSLMRAVDNCVERFFARRARKRRARAAASQRRASEFLKPIEGGGFQGWAHMRTGLMNSAFDRLVVTPETLTFAPGNPKHERTISVNAIVTINTNSAGMEIRLQDGARWQLWAGGSSTFDTARGNPRPLTDAWAEAIRAMVAGREPSFAREPVPGEVDPVEAAFNRVFDLDTLHTAPVRERMPHRALGYPFEWTLTPLQEAGLRTVCRELGEPIIGRIQTEYGRDRWEVVIDGGLYADAGALSIPHAFVSLEGRWGLWLTSRWFAVLACESEEMLAVFRQHLPEFLEDAIPAEVIASGGEWLRTMVAHVRGRD